MAKGENTDPKGGQILRRFDYMKKHAAVRLRLGDIFSGGGYIPVAVVLLVIVAIGVYFVWPRLSGGQKDGAARAVPQTPDNGLVSLGREITLPNLTVKPLSVELKKARGTMEDRFGKVTEFESESEVLVLTILLTNTSRAASFRPVTQGTLEGAVLTDSLGAKGENYGIFKYSPEKRKVEGQFAGKLPPGGSKETVVMALKPATFDRVRHFTWAVPLLTSDKAKFDEFERSDEAWISIRFTPQNIIKKP